MDSFTKISIALDLNDVLTAQIYIFYYYLIVRLYI